MARHAAVREHHKVESFVSESLCVSSSEPTEDRTVTLGDLHIIRELKIVNDNLKWRLQRQSMALDKTSQLVHKLTQQNAVLNSRLSQLTGGGSSADSTYI